MNFCVSHWRNNIIFYYIHTGPDRQRFVVAYVIVCLILPSITQLVIVCRPTLSPTRFSRASHLNAKKPFSACVSYLNWYTQNTEYENDDDTTSATRKVNKKKKREKKVAKKNRKSLAYCVCVWWVCVWPAFVALSIFFPFLWKIGKVLQINDFFIYPQKPIRYA